MCFTRGNDPATIKVDWESTKSLHNWVDRLNLTCEPGWKIGLMGSMFLLGWSLGCLFIPRLGDTMGRRRPYLFFSVASVFCYLTLILSQNIHLTLVMYFLLGLGNAGKPNLGYVYILELVPTSWQTYVGTLIHISDGCTLIFLSIYFRFISKDWFWFQLFCFVFSTLAIAGCSIAPESPKYLYSFERFDEARAAIKKIARFNRVSKDIRNSEYLFDTEVVH